MSPTRTAAENGRPKAASSGEAMNCMAAPSFGPELALSPSPAPRRASAMSQKFDALSPEHKDFIARQKIFFVATAAPEGRVNVSPKGMASFAVLGDNAVAYLDCTGSGNETRAHLLVSPRLTIMFCRLRRRPAHSRLYGQGRSYLRGSADYAALLPAFRGDDRRAADRPARRRSRADLVRHGGALFRLPRRAARTSCATGRARASPACANIGRRRTWRASTACRPQLDARSDAAAASRGMRLRAPPAPPRRRGRLARSAPSPRRPAP